MNEVKIQKTSEEKSIYRDSLTFFKRFFKAVLDFILLRNGSNDEVEAVDHD